VVKGSRVLGKPADGRLCHMLARSKQLRRENMPAMAQAASHLKEHPGFLKATQLRPRHMGKP
jgi:hypothetical protein